MERTLYEQLGGGYTQVGDYQLPNLLAVGERQELGPWGCRHLRYLRQHKRITYTNLLTSGKLPAYLVEIDRQAQDLFFRLVQQYAAAEGVTEQLKAEDQMVWAGQMNNIRARVTEIVNAEVIYA